MSWQLLFWGSLALFFFAEFLSMLKKITEIELEAEEEQENVYG